MKAWVISDDQQAALSVLNTNVKQVASVALNDGRQVILQELLTDPDTWGNWFPFLQTLPEVEIQDSDFFRPIVGGMI